MAIPESGVLYASQFSELLQCDRLSIMDRIKSSKVFPWQVSLVAALSRPVCPSAIPSRKFCAWAGVRAVIVNAVQGQSWGTWPHIFKKLFERVAPRIGHRNATTAIVRELPAVLIEAAISRGVPRFEFFRSRHAVRQRGDRHLFEAVTPAASCRVIAEILTNNYNCLATRAKTIPFCATVRGSLWMKRYHDESAKCHSGQVFEVISEFARLMFSHGASRGAAVRAVHGADYTVAARLV